MADGERSEQRAHSGRLTALRLYERKITDLKSIKFSAYTAGPATSQQQLS